MTYTYVTLEVSQAAYQEIRGLLEAAGYGRAFAGDLIDMHGIALCPKPPASPRLWPRCYECGREVTNRTGEQHGRSGWVHFECMT